MVYELRTVEVFTAFRMRMVEVIRADHNPRAPKPFRVSVDGIQLRNKKGEPKKFASVLEALSYAQRYSEKNPSNRK